MNSKKPIARVLAYYLPQYHPIPENDNWWGKGFTEWTNVGKAKPLFPGHYQPHVPADLGYYDLRVPETRKAQADMAREHGVEGFVYWHYWFGNGKRLLERPFNEVLASGEPDFPFALAWANETWSGTLHGLVKGHTLIEQTYPGDEDYIAHFYAILPAFKDIRYITCDDKPIFLIYKFDKIPDLKHYIELWNRLAVENGLKGIYFIACGHNMWKKEETDRYQDEMMSYGFDAVTYLAMRKVQPKNIFSLVIGKIRQDIFKWPIRIKYNPTIFSNDTCRENDNAFPSIVPNWDHTPRSGRHGLVLTESTPKAFERACEFAKDKVIDKPYDKRFIFLKSWNEWAEGNHMEPDRKYGNAYLDVLKRVFLD